VLNGRERDRSVDGVVFGVRRLDRVMPKGSTIVVTASLAGLTAIPDDPIYGSVAREASDGPVALGLLSPRGERAVLTVPVDVLMRVTSARSSHAGGRLSAWVR
jgi:hypothetical protein